MSGYVSGIVAILCINLIFAYGIFVPAAAGQINLGGAGFQAIGAYGAALAFERRNAADMDDDTGRDADRRSGRLPDLLPGSAHARRLHGARDLRVRRGRRGLFIVDATSSAGRSAWSCRRTWRFLSSSALCVAVTLLDILSDGDAIWACHALDQRRRGGRGPDGRQCPRRSRSRRLPSAARSPACRVLSMHSISASSRRSISIRCFSIYVLLFVLIGGVQTAWGPLIGTLFFTLLPEFMRIGGSWRYVVFGAAIVLLMIFRPQGIVTRAMIDQLSPRRWALRRAAMVGVLGR